MTIQAEGERQRERERKDDPFESGSQSISELFKIIISYIKAQICRNVVCGLNENFYLQLARGNLQKGSREVHFCWTQHNVWP